MIEESLNKRTIKISYIDIYMLAKRPDSKTVMAQMKDYFDDYNLYHQQSALDYLTQKLFREREDG